jgi:hypothetical protein
MQGISAAVRRAEAGIDVEGRVQLGARRLQVAFRQRRLPLRQVAGGLVQRGVASEAQRRPLAG